MIEKPLQTITAFGLTNIPEVEGGDNIGGMVVSSMESLGGIRGGDIYIIASKIVSKSEGRVVNLSEIQPTLAAIELHNIIQRKSPELCQVILNESQRYFIENNVIVATHKLGFRLTSAGVDRIGQYKVMLLPVDPDISAQKIMFRINKLTNHKVAVIISDSEGRADRLGTQAISIGVAGINPLRVTNYIDDKGKERKTEETLSDLLACQAAVIMGQRGKNIPVVCIRGVDFEYDSEANLQSIIHKI